jgi:hypothetical protein
MEDKNKKEKKQSELSPMDLERLELLRKAGEKTGKQLRIDLETGSLDEIDELRQLVGKDFENPDEKYNIYYKGIRNILIQYLPKGVEFKEARDIIYDEKNIFLNSGKKKSDNNGIRGSDGRMTFQPRMNEMLDIILKWVSESQNPFDLYNRLHELNDKLGYGHENYDATTLSFANAMKILSSEL